MSYTVLYSPLYEDSTTSLGDVSTLAEGLVASVNYLSTGEELLPCNVQAVPAAARFAPVCGWYVNVPQGAGKIGILMVTVTPEVELPNIPVAQGSATWTTKDWDNDPGFAPTEPAYLVCGGCGENVPVEVAYSNESVTPFHWNSQGGGHTMNPKAYENDPVAPEVTLPDIPQAEAIGPKDAEALASIDTAVEELGLEPWDPEPPAGAYEELTFSEAMQTGLTEDQKAFFASLMGKK